MAQNKKIINEPEMVIRQRRGRVTKDINKREKGTEEREEETRVATREEEAK